MKKSTNDFRKLMVDDSAVAALVSTRVYQNAAPQNPTFPFVVYSLSSVERPKTHDQRDNSTRRKADLQTFEVSVYATDPDTVADIAEAIDNAVDGRDGADAAGSYVFLFQNASTGAAYRQDNSGLVDHTATLQFTARRRPHD